MRPRTPASAGVPLRRNILFNATLFNTARTPASAGVPLRRDSQRRIIRQDNSHPCFGRGSTETYPGAAVSTHIADSHPCFGRGSTETLPPAQSLPAWLLAPLLRQGFHETHQPWFVVW